MEEGAALTLKIIVSVFLGGLLYYVANLYTALVLKPRRTRSKLVAQGIEGPSPSFLLGNIADIKKIQLLKKSAAASNSKEQGSNVLSHDWFPKVFPHLDQWRREYGSIYMYSTGNIQLLFITDIEVVKEISLSTSLSLGKPSYLSKDRGPLFGQGILASSGDIWAHQRKVIAPELFLDKVKGMVNLMVDCTVSALKSWETEIENEGGIADINIERDLRRLSADIIARASFGSNYSQGEEIFLKLRKLQGVMSKATVGIPGLRYLPSKTNREIWKLEKEINSMILNLTKQRMKASHERDLLQMILEGAKNYDDLSSYMSHDKFIIDNCKNIYFAGHETTAITASWCLMLLAAHLDWQDRTRAEILKLCKDGLPDSDVLRSLKTLTMVIQETLRLYPPAQFIVREALEDIKLRDILLPKGINTQIPVTLLQQDPDLWGPDALQFNPERFSGGILRACENPQAYLPFGVGPHVCAGQHFAMTELKVILAIILSKYSFSLSPGYDHCPAFRLVVQPGNGVRLVMRKP